MTAEKKTFSIRSFAFSVVTWFFILAVSALLAEIGLRTYEVFQKGIPFGFSLKDLLHEKYGWKGANHIFGSPNNRFTIMVLGDSYTDGERVPVPFMYYTTLRLYSGSNMFVYGGTGYGTLQQSLVLEDNIDKIKPDLILLQVTFNDFSDNSLELHQTSDQRSAIFYRPFLVNGKIENHFLKSIGPIILYSRAAYRFQHFLDNMRYLIKTRSGSRPASDREKELREEAINITDQLIGRFVEKAGSTPVAAFISEGSPEDIATFARLFQKHSVPFIPEVPGYFDALQKSVGKDLTLGPGRGHWAPEAHMMIGGFLAKRLVDMGLLPDHGPVDFQEIRKKIETEFPSANVVD